MAEQYLHGVELVEVDDGTRPISTVTSGIIGIVGTAPAADDAAFPLNEAVLVSGSRRTAAKLGTAGTLPQAMTGIFDQVGAAVVVVRVAADEDTARTTANVVGGVDSETGQYTGIQQLVGAESAVGVQPRILIAPGFSNQKAVADALISAAERLRAFVILDGPNTTDAEAINYREQFGSRRCEIVDPWYKVFDTESAATITEPPSARHAGVMARVQNEQGFWWSNSNQEIQGISGLCRPVDFKLDDVNCRANVLNQNCVTTTIQQDGFRVWGDRTCTDDSKWIFKNVVITNDMIADSLVRNHLWAVDRNITKTYVDDVTEGVNDYLRHLVNIGAIAGGQCWVDPELNTADQIQAGSVYFDYDFSAFAPAEHITFRSHMVNGYLTEVV